MGSQGQRDRRGRIRRAGVGLFVAALLAAALYLTVIAPLRSLDSGEGPGAQQGQPATVAPGGSPAPAPTGSSPAAPDHGDPSGAAMPTGDLPGWRQFLAEDFSGTALNEQRWTSYTGQPLGDPGGWFDPSHVSVGGGLLTIGGWRDPARGNIYVTGGVATREPHNRAYGRFDIRFRMDQGTGIAYALLLWPTSNQYPPEIDIAEDNGRLRDRMYGVLHPRQGDPISDSVSGDFTRWHTAGVEWTPQRLVFTVDGRPWKTITGDRVPAEPMKLALQTQAWNCGHSWEACPNARTPALVNLQVDWVVGYAPQ